MTSKVRSPVGRSLEASVDDQLTSSAEYRQVRAELAAFERLARVVLVRRTELGLTQSELAERMQTTASVVSRIESGQHTTSIKTLQRLADALEASFVFGFRIDERHDELVELQA